MSYRLVKNLFGTNHKDVICDIDIPYEIYDFCFIPEFGYLLALRDNHCISYVNLEGKLTVSWMGDLNQQEYKEGKGRFARLSYPSSICYSPHTKKGFVIEDGGASIRSLNLDTVYISPLLGRAVLVNLRNNLAKVNILEAKTSCCADDHQQVFWTIDRTHKCYKFKQGEVNVILGTGRPNYSISSNVNLSALNNPKGIVVTSNKICIVDAGNHCIRALSKNKIDLIEGTPLDKNIVNSPSCLKYTKGLFYYLDKSEVKYFSLSGSDRGIIYQGEHLVAIDVDGRDLLILERDNAKT